MSRKNYLLQVLKSGSEPIRERHIKDIYLEAPIIPISEITNGVNLLLIANGVNLLLWECIYAHDVYSTNIEDIKDYRKYQGEWTFV